MIEKILERLEEESVYLNIETDVRFVELKEAKEIVQEVAKEYGTKHLPTEYDWIPFEMREMDEGDF